MNFYLNLGKFPSRKNVISTFRHHFHSTFALFHALLGFLCELISGKFSTFNCCQKTHKKSFFFTISPANGRAIFTICGLKGNWIWADGMLHRCAFGVPSSLGTFCAFMESHLFTHEQLSLSPSLRFPAAPSLQQLTKLFRLISAENPLRICRGADCLSLQFPKLLRHSFPQHPLSVPIEHFLLISPFFSGKSAMKIF